MPTTSPQLLTASNTTGAWQLSSATLPASVLKIIPENATSATELTLSDTRYTVLSSPAASSSSKPVLTFLQHDSTDYFKHGNAIELPEPADMVKCFYLGGQPYLVTYRTEASYLNFYQVNNNLTLTPIHNQYVGRGFTMIEPLAYRDTTCIALYNGTSGECVKYQVTVPPYFGLSLQSVWSDVWAKTWGHFSFFQFGGENFFLKVNQSHEKVNIDHFMDDPDEGSHPVLSKPACNTMLNAAAIATCSGSEGQAYFWVYQSNGSLSLNSIYPNCLGWWSLVSGTTSDNATLVHPTLINNQACLLVLS